MTEPEDLLDSAPLLRELRTRHPDVDVVVLPPVPPPGPAPTPVPEATLDAEAAWVTTTMTSLLVDLPALPETDASSEGVAAPPGDRTAPHWRTAPAAPAADGTGVVMPVAEVRLAVPDVETATSVANLLAQRMAAQGWEGALHTSGTTARLDATVEERTLRVVRLETAVLVTVTGRPLTVPRAHARELVTRGAGNP